MTKLELAAIRQMARVETLRVLFTMVEVGKESSQVFEKAYQQILSDVDPMQIAKDLAEPVAKMLETVLSNLEEEDRQNEANQEGMS